MAMMPNPLWRSSYSFTTQDSRRAYGHGAPLERPLGTLLQSAALGSLDPPDGLWWSLLTRGTTLAVARRLCWPYMLLPLWW